MASEEATRGCCKASGEHGEVALEAQVLRGRSSEAMIAARSLAGRKTVDISAPTSGWRLARTLANGIYPQQATSMKTISNRQSTKKFLFAQMQEGERKDVERAFGQIEHNMMVEDECRQVTPHGLTTLESFSNSQNKNRLKFRIFSRSSEP